MGVVGGVVGVDVGCKKKRKKKPPHTLIRREEGKNLMLYEKAGGVEQEVRG